MALLAFLTFLPALGHDFLVYDDDQYVTANPAVRAGLTGSSVRWAFTSGHAANWHPLTWLGHMVDVQVWGLVPRGHHLTNLLLHAANAAVLFLALQALTGAPWRSALVAALFAVHPTRIEAVAWVAERKELLSALFGFLALLAYAAWARRGGRGQPWGALALFAAGLLAKPMLVRLPFVLILLDVWPLGRVSLDARPVRALLRGLIEKAPFLLLAAVSCAVTFVVQRAGGAVGTLESYPARPSGSPTRSSPTRATCAAWSGRSTSPSSIRTPAVPLRRRRSWARPSCSPGCARSRGPPAAGAPSCSSAGAGSPGCSCR